MWAAQKAAPMVVPKDGEKVEKTALRMAGGLAGLKVYGWVGEKAVAMAISMAVP